MQAAVVHKGQIIRASLHGLHIHRVLGYASQIKYTVDEYIGVTVFTSFLLSSSNSDCMLKTVFWTTVILFLYQPSLNRMLMDRPSVFVFCMCTASLSVVYILCLSFCRVGE